MISEENVVQLATQLRENLERRGVKIEQPPQWSADIFLLEVRQLIRDVEKLSVVFIPSEQPE